MSNDLSSIPGPTKTETIDEFKKKYDILISKLNTDYPNMNNTNFRNILIKL